MKSQANNLVLTQFRSSPYNVFKYDKLLKNRILNLTLKYGIVLLFIINISDICCKQKDKEKKNQKEGLKYLTPLTAKEYPDDLDEISNILDKDTKDCFQEVVNIYTRDFSNVKDKINLIKTMPYTDKFFEKIDNHILKKINKINFYENKNFTGVRWIDFKSSNNTELKRMMDSHLQLLANFIQQKFPNEEKQLSYIYSNHENISNQNNNNKNTNIENKKNSKNRNKSLNSSDTTAPIIMNLPEIIVDSYQYFYSKINDLKKSFSKFYLFKGINKFNRCIASKKKIDRKFIFSENLKIGKITIKTLLVTLREIFSLTYEIVKANSASLFSKALKRLILLVKEIPGM